MTATWGRPGAAADRLLAGHSTTGTVAAQREAERAGLSDLIRPARSGRLLFHWTSEVSAAQIRREGGRVPRKGQSLHGERLGQGFYVAPRVEQWTNLDPSYRPLVLRTDRSFRVVGEEWVRRTGRIPTARIARRYGFDGFEGQTEMLVFNMEHIRVLDEVEAIPHLRAGFRKVRPTWNLGSAILESARAILSPDEMADFVPRTMVRNVLAHKRSIAELGKNPARRALVVMTRLGLNPHNPSSVEPLIDALRTSIDDPGIPEDERALRERVLSEVLPLRPTGRTFEERMGPYSAARPLVVRAVRRILREADPPGNVPQP